MPDFSSYLESVRRHYKQWWKDYAFMDEIDELTWFEFPLSSTTKEKPTKPDEQPGDFDASTAATIVSPDGFGDRAVWRI